MPKSTVLGNSCYQLLFHGPFVASPLTSKVLIHFYDVGRRAFANLANFGSDRILSSVVHKCAYEKITFYEKIATWIFNAVNWNSNNLS